ncbi:uncharacterized protein Dwil_GK17591 [Drosophila willistoni]|uniref:Uncharacterized protein n=1 Tax=Drosophila willistoni TaxID=7260 RepID=B4MMW7_DROWI|nr:uncharacterized protein Dwil_GK17591 [Drosophila willistoni]
MFFGGLDSIDNTISLEIYTKMKLFIACILIAAATAAVIPVEQVRHRRDVSEIVNEYIPPVEEVAADVPVETITQDSAIVGEDGYRYKTVRRLKLRHRRDVSKIANEYLPPSEEVAPIVSEPVEESQDSAVLADDGYQYKTVRRLKYRQRRDVSEIANEYLPPSEEVAPIVSEPVEESQDSAVLADDGYQYKTVRRLKYRQRRDVSEIANEYLPPSEEAVTEAPLVEEAPEESQDSAVLADDGYQYKTVRRLKYRQRRDVSEIANEYLPPSEEVAPIVSEPVEESQDSAVLADDGYQYKTVRRLKYRQRRDVSEIANEYLPPSEDVAPIVSEPVEESQDSAVLADDGYQYKTVRRLKYRQRRDVSEIANEYLPPSEEAVTEAPLVEEAPEESQDSAVLADDGYQYKTVRRLKYRQRRDVSEIANEYLPPSEEVAPIVSEPVEESQDSAVLADDGYQYKTVRRLKYRQRRDVSEIANEYHPPSEETVTEAPLVEEAPEESQDSAVLANDGYQYKTVRRLKYRQRRDVSEIANEYLPPSEEAVTEAPLVEEAPEESQDSAVLANDGYQYKTVRRLKYRQRRDVSEIDNEYLPPSEEVAPIVSEPVEESQDSAVLADDGYQYKTVRRLKYRQRRDVSEIANEYLPPSEDVAPIVSEPVEESQDSAVLADDGYQYKTVRRLKYRQRRDVSEIANEYLPPSEEAVTEAALVEEAPEESQDSAVLANDGYQYKTVRRLKYRQRRDVSEIANEYLPPSEEAVTEAPLVEEAPEEKSQDSAVLADDGYQYKTVRRLKYRQRRDVSEIANEYLPPSEETVTEAPLVEEAPEESQDSAVLANDGYQYKTVRRLKYRQRRDVSEIANEYLPPSEEAVTEAPLVEEAPEESQDSAVLANDGYQYKTVRRLKYRQRREVS